jgi:PleD family two-component response regulator
MKPRSFIPPNSTDYDESGSLSDKHMDDLPRRILIVDDNADAAQSLSLLMEVKGHECKVVFDSKKALAAALDFKPEYVFLDLGMPGENGYDLCEHMRAQPELKKTIFIAQTGWSQDEYVERAKRAGFHHHLVKPIDYRELEQILKKDAA